MPLRPRNSYISDALAALMNDPFMSTHCSGSDTAPTDMNMGLGAQMPISSCWSTGSASQLLSTLE